MKIILSFLVVSMFSIVNALTAQNKEITVTVVNATANEGQIGFALFDKDSFMKTPLSAKMASIENGKSSIVFNNVSDGVYAILCYHDKNNNGKMDFTPNGIPLESYGASNNNMRFAPPTFDESKFVVTDKNVTLNIRF